MSRCVVVTGAAGLVGTAVVTDLTRAGIGVVRLVAERDRAAADTGTGPDADLVVGDAADPAVVDTVMRRARARAGSAPVGVVHLAAIPSPNAAAPETVFVNNVAATFAVLEGAGRAGVARVAIASSLSALGLAFGRRTLRPRYLPLDEAHPILAEDAYAASKVTDEHTAAMMHRRWGYDVVALRLPFIGHGERLATRAAEIERDPGALAHELWAWVHTLDAARAFRHAVTRAVPGCHVVTVAAPDVHTDIPTAQLLAAHLPEVELRRPLTGHEVPLDLRAATDLLGFTAEHRWRDRARRAAGAATI